MTGSLASTAGCGMSSKGPAPVEVVGVRNLVQDGCLYVSGASSAEGLKELKARGVRTVIDLRLEDQVSPEEPEAVRKEGLTYVHLPMKSAGMTDDQAAHFLKTISQHAAEPVLIHCRTGNRSAAMYGLYIGSLGQCSVDEAITRARKAGMKNETLAQDVRRYLESHKCR